MVLKKKHKIVISASIILNIFLISIVIWFVNQMNYVTERTLKTNVINKLFELNETVSKQGNENWSDLAFISKQLEDTGLSTAHALNTGVTSKTINKDDSEMLLKLSNYFIRYSSITNSEISPEYLEGMKLDLIWFNTILTEQGFDNEQTYISTKQGHLKKLRNIVSEIEKEEGVF